MNIAEYSIKRSVITWMMVILLVVGGAYAYQHIGRFEDPEFTIKEAMVITQYPGATPREVEEEVTDKLETAIQQLPQLKRVTSISRPGVSEITVVIKDQYTRHDLPQIWDELRRKVNDVQRDLPPGAGPSLVNDDYGDVFGMLFAVTGDGYSYKELKHYTKIIRRELLLVPGVGKVQMTGERQEAIFVEISRARMAQLGISLDDIYALLSSQNLVTASGNVQVGDEYIRISPTGAFDSVNAIGNLLVRSTKSKRLLHLSDISNIKRDYKEVPRQLIFFNGQPALNLGVSIVSGGNVVKIGEAVGEKLHQLANIVPAGIEVTPIYNQPKIVDESVTGFIVSLGQAVAIVIAVLLIFMGLRSGLIIASILLITVFGTLLIMYLNNIFLERISLGALIIALGMLVDNAIVVTEGILVRVEQGVDKIVASKEVVAQTLWPLFGATLVGILAFAAISLSQDSTGEYTASLFYVILISLLLSWILAVTVAPLFCYLFLKERSVSEVEDPYQGFFYQLYKSFLYYAIKVRWLTVALMFGMLIVSIWGFQFVKQSFFPNSTNPVFLVDYWRPQGTDIRRTAKDTLSIEKRIRKMEGVEDVTSVVGAGAQRFTLVYTPEKTNSSYSQFIIRVKDYSKIDMIGDKVLEMLASQYPNSEPKMKKIRLGPGKDAKIEIRFSGPDPNELRRLSNEAQRILASDPNAIAIRDDWRQRVKVIVPVFAEAQARLTGISRMDLSDALQTAFSGKSVGLYRERDELIPIVSRPPDMERLNIANIDDLAIWSPLLLKTVPIGQLVSKFNTEWQDEVVRRRNRKLTITASAEPRSGLASEVVEAVWNKIAAMKLPTGYEMEWGGEYEDSHDAQVALAKKLPVGFLMMIIIVVLLFGKVRQPLIIWLCVPLSFIGVTAGLLLTHSEFGFMALLGFLSLSGMLIKNAIVLVDQIDLEIKEGKPVFQAIIDSSLARARPVALAAVTTVLGMIPLLFDAFFQSMSVVIMFGLSFATVLTLIILPVLYAIFFKAKLQKPHYRVNAA